MPCLIGCLAIGFPRVALLLVVFFSDFLGDAYQNMLWPFLGFFFMPLTTLAYAWAWHANNGSIQGVGLVILVIAVLMDLGLLGTGANSSRGRVVYYQQGPGRASMSGGGGRPRKKV